MDDSASSSGVDVGLGKDQPKKEGQSLRPSIWYYEDIFWMTDRASLVRESLRTLNIIKRF